VNADLSCSETVPNCRVEYKTVLGVLKSLVDEGELDSANRPTSLVTQRAVQGFG